MSNIDCFTRELESLINRYSMEHYWDMPDYLMAKFISNFITGTSTEMKLNMKWHKSCVLIDMDGEID